MEIEEVWKNARSIENMGPEDQETLGSIGEVQRGKKLYCFYQGASGKTWYRVRVEIEGRLVSEGEAIFGPNKNRRSSRKEK